jgi:putative transposase
LINKIDSFVRRCNDDCKPFTWTPEADPIHERIARLCGRISGTGS